MGAFLVAAAAVGVFAAYINATAEPTTTYLVATQDIPVGGRVTEGMLRAVALDLPLELTDTAIPGDAADQLIGRQVLGPVSTNDLLVRTIFQSPSTPEGTATFSFSIAPSRALGGNVNPGDRIDLVATYDQQDNTTFTGYVARQVPILRSEPTDAGIVLTVAVADPALVLRMINALETAEVYILRSDPDKGDIPPDYLSPGPRSEPTEAEPAVDPDETEGINTEVATPEPSESADPGLPAATATPTDEGR